MHPDPKENTPPAPPAVGPVTEPDDDQTDALRDAATLRRLENEYWDDVGRLDADSAYWEWGGSP